jgi:small subunit ribosomal protein S6
MALIMPLYETTFIVRQDLSTRDVEHLADSYIKIIEDKGGQIMKREYWGLRDLAYKIKKNSKGHYVFLGVQATHDAMKEVEKKMKLTQDIIRCLIVRVKHLDKEATPMVKKTIEE